MQHVTNIEKQVKKKV